MRFAWWINNATDTHWEYVIRIASASATAVTRTRLYMTLYLHYLSSSFTVLFEISSSVTLACSLQLLDFCAAPFSRWIYLWGRTLIAACFLRAETCRSLGLQHKSSLIVGLFIPYPFVYLSICPGFFNNCRRLPETYAIPLCFSLDLVINFLLSWLLLLFPSTFFLDVLFSFSPMVSNP